MAPRKGIHDLQVNRPPKSPSLQVEEATINTIFIVAIPSDMPTLIQINHPNVCQSPVPSSRLGHSPPGSGVLRFDRPRSQAQGRHCCVSCNIDPTDGIPSGSLRSSAGRRRGRAGGWHRRRAKESVQVRGGHDRRTRRGGDSNMCGARYGMIQTRRRTEYGMLLLLLLLFCICG